MDAGFTTSQVEKYFAGFDHAIFTPTSSRQVLDVMNVVHGGPQKLPRQKIPPILFIYAHVR